MSYKNFPPALATTPRPTGKLAHANREADALRGQLAATRRELAAAQAQLAAYRRAFDLSLATGEVALPAPVVAL